MGQATSPKSLQCCNGRDHDIIHHFDQPPRDVTPLPTLDAIS